MTKTKHPSLLFVLILCIVLSLFAAIVNASICVSTTILSSGAINPSATPSPTPKPTATPTPTPTPSPNGNSLISITDGDWYTDGQWAKCPSNNVVLDTTDTYAGSPSWQITLSSVNVGADHGNINVKPGEVIYYSCWIKTSAATISADNSNPQAGGRIGIDFYGANGGITGIQTPDGAYGSSDTDNTFVKFGTNTWTQITMTFTIPTTYTATGAYSGSYTAGQQVTATSMIPWVEVWSDTQGTNEHGTAWFADPTFCINP